MSLDPQIRTASKTDNFSRKLIANLFTAQGSRPAHLGQVDVTTLSPFQRGLLVMLGLVTQFIEAYKLEPVLVQTLAQETLSLEQADPWLDLAAGSNVLSRRVLLVGKQSTTPYLFGEALIATDRLDDNVRQDLEVPGSALGRILIQRKVETSGELLWFGAEALSQMPEGMRHLAGYPLISRTYRFLANGKPIMLITERFSIDVEPGTDAHR
jgi:chorismate-pyruvate lyase